MIAFLFWPNNNRFAQSNKIDVSKTQIKILYRRINIREEADVNSKDIGDVYRGEVYTVISHIEKKDYNWYQIKTDSDIEGYIGSDPNNEYVKVISGYIDREPPKINIDSEPLILVNGKNDLDSVECVDDHGACSLSYEEIDSDTIKFKAVDDDKNVAVREVKFYRVYELISEFIDNSETVNSKYNLTKNGNTYIINANYQINKTVSSNHKSSNYSPMIAFYDKDFNEIKDINTSFNSVELKGSCINNFDNSLKEEYVDIDLLKGNTICMNYKFTKEDNIKYVAVGFSGIENYDDNENYLANYFSKYFMIN